MKKNDQIFVCHLAVAGIFLILAAGCKKEEPIKDCVTNNYGVVHTNFAATTTRHSILITQSGTTTAREKIVAIGTASDTLHLSPATWLLSIASIDNGGLAIDMADKTAITTQCSDETFTVTF